MLSASEMTSESTFLMPPIHDPNFSVDHDCFGYHKFAVCTLHDGSMTWGHISLGGIPNNYVSFTKHMREK